MKIYQNAPKFHDKSSNLLKTTEIRKILIPMGGGTILNTKTGRKTSDFKIAARARAFFKMATMPGENVIRGEAGARVFQDAT